MFGFEPFGQVKAYRSKTTCIASNERICVNSGNAITGMGDHQTQHSRNIILPFFISGVLWIVSCFVGHTKDAAAQGLGSPLFIPCASFIKRDVEAAQKIKLKEGEYPVFAVNVCLCAIPKMEKEWIFDFNAKQKEAIQSFNTNYIFNDDVGHQIESAMRECGAKYGLDLQ